MYWARSNTEDQENDLVSQQIDDHHIFFASISAHILTSNDLQSVAHFMTEILWRLLES